MRKLIGILAVLGLYAAACAAQEPADAVTLGELVVDPPTLVCLGFHWPISGDDDGDAVCRIRFREHGAEQWRQGLDLWRTNGETCGTDRWTPPSWKTPNAFAGSLFDLEPGTQYECRLEIADPDGVRGDAVRTVTVRTRPEPTPAAGGRVIEVRPSDVKRMPVHQKAQVVPATPLPELKGQTFNVFPPDADRELKAGFENARDGLLHAYYGYTTYCDWNWDPRRVQPGETIAIHAGEYKSDRRDYRVKAGYSLWFHGTHFLGQSGTPEQPIVIRAAGDGEVVFDGDGCDTLFDVTHADNLVFQGITFRNCRIAIKAGDASRGARNLRLIDCKFEDVLTPLLAVNEDCTGYQLSGNTWNGEQADLIDTRRAVLLEDRLFAPADVRPGDTFLLHGGIYNVVDPRARVSAAVMHGTYRLTADGTAEKPIVFKAAGDGDVIFDGGGCDTLFDVRAADHVYFEGITFRNAKIAIKAGVQYLNGCTGLTVKRCKFEEVGYAVMGTSGKCRDFYVADNHMRCWKVNKVRGAGNNQTFDREYGYGVNVLGTGHVVCYNDISDFWDNLNVTTNGHGDPAVGRPAIAIDFYNNVVGRAGDNGGEADGSVRNVRFMRNRCSFTCQPLWGGPVYFIRNLGEPTKYAEHPSGVVALHSTLGTISARGGKHSYVNNLVQWSYRPHLFELKVDSEPGSIDGNAYRLFFRSGVKRPEEWVLETPARKVAEATFEAFRRAAGIEEHGFTIESDSDDALVDRAVPLPNVNDEYAGEGPDVGPHEVGKPAPHYGPRP